MYSLVVSGDLLWALRPLTAGWQKKRRNEAAGSHNKNRFDNHPCFPAFLAITSLVPVNLFIMNTTDAVKAADNGFPSIVDTHFVMFLRIILLPKQIFSLRLQTDQSLWICGELTALGSVGGFLCRMWTLWQHCEASWSLGVFLSTFRWVQSRTARFVPLLSQTCAIKWHSMAAW